MAASRAPLPPGSLRGDGVARGKQAPWYPAAGLPLARAPEHPRAASATPTAHARTPAPGEEAQPGAAPARRVPARGAVTLRAPGSPRAAPSQSPGLERWRKPGVLVRERDGGESKSLLPGAVILRDAARQQ